MAQDLLILHGWNSQISRWKNLTAELEKAGFKVYLPILPGFKNGPELKRVWELADYISWVEQWIKDKKLVRPIILGHSFGGQIAAGVAINNQVKLGGLVLAAAAVIRGRRSCKQNFFYVFAKLGQLTCWLPPFCWVNKPLRWLLYRAAGAKDYYQAQGWLKPTMQNIINHDLSGQLKKVNLPTLILWGKTDQDTPLDQAKKLKRSLKNSRLKLYPGSHGFIFERPKQIAAELVKFAQSL